MSKEIKESKADSTQIYKKVKSELFHIWKKARLMYEMINEEKPIGELVKKNINSAYEAIDESLRYIEYESMFPEKQNNVPEEDESENNFLSNEDKRYPVPVNSDSGDQFVTRCILDANMKKRYPIQSDRFQACMKVFTETQQKGGADHNNPGEKFEDPMQPKTPETTEPDRPILP